MPSNATRGHPGLPQGPSPGPPHPGRTEGPNRCYFSANRAAPANKTIPVPAYHAPIGSPKSQPIPCPNGSEPRSGRDEQLTRFAKSTDPPTLNIRRRARGITYFEEHNTPTILSTSPTLPPPLLPPPLLPLLSPPPSHRPFLPPFVCSQGEKDVEAAKKSKAKKKPWSPASELQKKVTQR